MQVKMIINASIIIIYECIFLTLFHAHLELFSNVDKWPRSEPLQSVDYLPVTSMQLHSRAIFFSPPPPSPVCVLQFSKEKYLLESPPEKLRKELEEELKLSPADIRSHGWYHGHIPREVCRANLKRERETLLILYNHNPFCAQRVVLNK